MQMLKLAQVLSLQASRVKRLLSFPSHTSLSVQLVFSHLGGEETCSLCERAAGIHRAPPGDEQ